MLPRGLLLAACKHQLPAKSEQGVVTYNCRSHCLTQAATPPKGLHTQLSAQNCSTSVCCLCLASLLAAAKGAPVAALRPGCRSHSHALGASQRGSPAPAQQQRAKLQVRNTGPGCLPLPDCNACSCQHHHHWLVWHWPWTCTASWQLKATAAAMDAAATNCSLR